MSYAPTTDPKFLERWSRGFAVSPEILLLIRYFARAGSKDFEFFSSFESIADRIRGLPPLTCVNRVQAASASASRSR
jgi:hypothetical protein